jgi:hypothetical protein
MNTQDAACSSTYDHGLSAYQPGGSAVRPSLIPFAIVAVALTACGGGGSESTNSPGSPATKAAPAAGAFGDPGRIASLQAFMDKNPPWVNLLTGRACMTKISFDIYHAKFPDAHFTAAGEAGHNVVCRVVTWPANFHVGPRVPGQLYARIPVGHYAVTRVGDDSAQGGGVPSAPFDATFTPIEPMYHIALHSGQHEEPNVTDGLVTMHKDGQGQWVTTGFCRPIPGC